MQPTLFYHFFLYALQDQLDHYTGLEMEWGDGEDGDAHVLELKLKALILDIIHHISIVDSLMKADVQNVDEWEWQKQLR